MTADGSTWERRARLALAFRSDLASVEVFDTFAAGGIETVLLRGPAIARRLYAEGERGYADCDVLVPEHAWKAAIRVASELGYKALTPLATAQHWLREGDGAELDFHLTLIGVTVPPAELWRVLSAHRRPLELDGTSVPALDLGATAFVIALHAGQHGSFVGHTLDDLERALERWDDRIWREAVELAEAAGGLAAFRQALTMLPAGRKRLAELALDPEVTVRSTLRQQGVELPNYLLEHQSARERLAILARRIAPSREEVSVYFDPRAATSTPRLLAVHAHRLARFPGRAVRFAAAWRRARRTTPRA